MPDTPNPPTPTPTPTPPAPPPPPTPPGEPLGDGGKAALDAERKARRDAEKAAKELAERLKAIEDKDKSELEKAQALAADLQAKYATAEAQRLRLQVATTHGIGSDDLVLMTGTTEDELAAQARRIVALNTGRAAATAIPAFVPAPGQAAGNGTPPATTPTVDAGRDLYRKKHAKT